MAGVTTIDGVSVIDILQTLAIVVLTVRVAILIRRSK